MFRFENVPLNGYIDEFLKAETVRKCDGSPEETVLLYGKFVLQKKLKKKIVKKFRVLKWKRLLF